MGAGLDGADLVRRVVVGCAARGPDGSAAHAAPAHAPRATCNGTVTQPRFTFRVHDERLAICRLPHKAPLPEWVGGGFVSIGRTRTELSIVCAQRLVPGDVQQERDRIAFGIDGVVPMTTIGLLAALCTALAEAAVPVFVISTYDTDWLLVMADRFAAARAALERLGHRLVGAPPAD